jgi:SAM-dependent methyltransferase
VFRSIRRSLRRLGSTEQHWARVVMDRETERLVRALSPETLDVLEISGSTWSSKLPFKSYREAHYPQLDICRDALAQSFDLIIAEQVFEHLEWPYRAGRNVHRMLNPGGHFLVTTPFLLRVHNHPGDCSRWTESGLKHLLAECGFDLERIHSGAWGNRKCVRDNFTDWVHYRPWIDSLKNEPLFPVVVWALAQK